MPKNVPFADIPEHVCSVTGPVVLVFLDIEHTGHPVYYADMMQFGAVAHYFDQGAFTATPALTFVEDTYTAQTINFALGPHFHQSFLRSRLRDASQFADVMAAFKLELTNVMHSLKCSSCMFVGHNIFKCDAVVLQCQFARIGVQFEQFLEDVNCLGCVDTMQLSQSIPALQDVKKSVGGLYNHIFKTELLGAHDALVDARATAALVMSPLFQARLVDGAPIGRQVAPMLKHIHDKKEAYELVSEKIVIPLVQGCDIVALDMATLAKLPDADDELQYASDHCSGSDSADEEEDSSPANHLTWTNDITASILRFDLPNKGFFPPLEFKAVAGRQVLTTQLPPWRSLIVFIPSILLHWKWK